MQMATACPPVMGNGVIDECEECDDGNLIDGDGCSAEGRIETNSATNMGNKIFFLFAMIVFYYLL